VAGAYTNGFDRGIYDRGRLRHKGTEIATVYGLPEFDTPGFATQLALALAPRLKGHVRVFNPGQGLVPAALPDVSVADRDLLAIRNTQRNASLSDGEPDAVIALLREHEPLAVTQSHLAGFEHVLVAGTSTQVTRLIEATRADVVERRKTRGFSATLLALSVSGRGK
jgi:hypothetical protein